MKRLVILIIFLSAFLFAFYLQFNSKRNAELINFCPNTGNLGLRCKYSFNSGFPFTYYSLKRNIVFKTEDACFQYASQCGQDKLTLQKINVLLFLLDVIIFTFAFAVVPLCIYGLLSLLGIAFHLSWLVGSLGLSIVFNILSIIPIYFLPIPLLGYISLFLTSPIINILGIGGADSSPLLLVETILLPLLLGALIFYLIIWGIWKFRNKK